MEKIFASIFPIFLFCSSLFSEIQPGTLTVTCTPQDSGGTSGTWEVDIFCPYGVVCSTGQVPISSTDPVVVSPVGGFDGFIETGAYIIELESSISNPTNSFLSSITLECVSDPSIFNTITFKNFPVLANGENTMINYFIPSFAEREMAEEVSTIP